MPPAEPQPLTRRRFTSRLFAWHAAAERPLAIRAAATAWEVLVAEVMSQQTGIERVGPYWRRFLDAWPTPAALADAPTRDLLAAWAGLGYNRRALALREAARTLVARHGGAVPRTVAALEDLPGIGPYTARAIAATAFGVAVAPLDVNVRRVLGRVTGLGPAAPGLQAAADDLVARRRPRAWLNAVMDLAVQVCRPARPACDGCPLLAVCATRGPGEPARGGGPAVPFPATARWLRGRLVALATGAGPGGWIDLPGQLGSHDRPAVHRAAEALAREGFLDLEGDRIRVRP